MTLKNARNLTVIGPTLVAVAVLSYLWRHFELDDGLIYLRYVKNFQLGHGLVFNPGERFNGLTSPLFTYIMVLGSLGVSNLQVLTIALSGVFFFVAAILATKLLARTVYGELLTALAITLFTFFYSTFGMETPLLLMLIGFSLYLYEQESEFTFIALALLVLTRSEGIFLAGPIFIDFIVRKRRLPRIGIIGLASFIVLAPPVFNKFYYGAFLPGTANAKIGQGKSGYWGEGWVFLDVDYLFVSIKYQLFFIASSAYGFFINRHRSVARLAMVFVVLLFGFYTFLNIPSYHWYFGPFVYLGMVFSCAGVEHAVQELSRRRLPIYRRLIPLTMIVFLAFFYGRKNRFVFWGRNDAYFQSAEWVKTNTSAKSSIASIEIGTFGYYADRHLIDILGLVNAFNADYIGQRDVYGWLNHYQPDYILRHRPRLALEESTRVLENIGAYDPVETFQVPGLVMLKKTGRITDQEIAQLPMKARESRMILKAASASSNGESMKYGVEGLEVPLPSSVEVALTRFSQAVAVTFGLNEISPGQVPKACFEIVRLEQNQSIFSKCIDHAVKDDRTEFRETIRFNGKAGERLALKVSCSEVCEASSRAYWGEFSIQ